MIPILIILAWVACGVIAYGAALADFRREYPTLPPGRDFRFALSIGVFGPIGLLSAMSTTAILRGRPFRHGLMFRVRL